MKKGPPSFPMAAPLGVRVLGTCSRTKAAEQLFFLSALAITTWAIGGGLVAPTSDGRQASVGQTGHERQAVQSQVAQGVGIAVPALGFPEDASV